MQKSRPVEAFQQVLSAFKVFEKKLDKLQDDVNSHGHTLSDLQTLVSNLAIGIDPKIYQHLKLDEKRQNKSTAVQYDNRPIPPMEGLKTKRKNTIHSLPSKIKTKTAYPAQTLVGMRSINAEPAFGRMGHSLPKLKQSSRPGKTGSTQKTTRRSKKGSRSMPKPK